MTFKKIILAFSILSIFNINYLYSQNNCCEISKSENINFDEIKDIYEHIIGTWILKCSSENQKCDTNYENFSPQKVEFLLRSDVESTSLKSWIKKLSNKQLLAKIDLGNGSRLLKVDVSQNNLTWHLQFKRKRWQQYNLFVSFKNNFMLDRIIVLENNSITERNKVFLKEITIPNN